ncbi:MAG TPA: tRNA preQ1(34) S-adenosylmethionine ribosyltransferase-isomerase QueA [Pelolinea sp.]|nr:tRNA preQ1(34) S-adenosylmethionine ribosyltransferase-isomerase QueA [Pelolinea sp.]
MKTEDFYYHLPEELIAQTPLPVRHDSRLLVFHRKDQTIDHSQFKNISQYVTHGDLLVINKTKVIPARLFAKKETGGKVEVLLLRDLGDNQWEILVGGKRVNKGIVLYFPKNIRGVIREDLAASKRIIEFDKTIKPYLGEIGQMPLPPYIHKRLENPERYQTIYAEKSGSAAAPTAGLHFTNEIIQQLKEKGINFAEITLHVGLDTFAPVTEEKIEDHVIHTEWCEIDQINADKINLAKKNNHRIIAVGTTSVRTLESAVEKNLVVPYSGPTSLFIIPGYQFKIVDSIITNFHLPESTLIMLISAFAGKENVMKCYEEAIREKYRFYSFGDAMLIT